MELSVLLDLVRGSPLLGFVFPLAAIFAMEIGDKTQLLTLAMATRYSFRQVFFGVLLASAVMMALAVAAGQVLFELIPAGIVNSIAGILFIGFGVWILKNNEKEEESSVKTGLPPVTAVFLAFLVAEFGDKTQLVTVPMAAAFNSPLEVWLGATTGMVGANLIGVVVGKKLGERFSTGAVEKGAGILFILFGFLFLGENFLG